jgi:maleylpyruvate isomerase
MMEGGAMANGQPLTLYGFWRSGTSHRLRIALNWKALDYRIIPVSLPAKAHRNPDYLTLNPQGLVPSLQIGDQILTQSPAIIEWLEEVNPTPPLLPSDAEARAIVSAMAAIIGCDIHPINNLRVLTSLRQNLGQDEDAVSAWIGRWISAGFEALEQLIAVHGGEFAYGDVVTVADCYLIPQIYSAQRFSVDLTPYPRIRLVGEKAGLLPAFAAAHPDCQPDAPGPVNG